MAKQIELTGQRFGKLLVLERDRTKQSERTFWKCQCDCGSVCSVKSQSLRKGMRTDCGCISGLAKDNSLIDLTGKRFGRLYVKEKAPRQKNRGTQWVCICDCGNTCIVSSRDLRIRGQKSCGCESIKNLQGQHLGKLTVLERSDKYITIADGTRKYMWKCQCDCGEIVYRLSQNLKVGTDCSCYNCRIKAAVETLQMKAGYVEGTQLCKINNMQPTSRSKSGIRGVCWNSRKNKWRAALQFKGVNHYLGEFTDLQDAVKARKKAEGIYFGEFLETLDE